jgi:hypothetical protein
MTSRATVPGRYMKCGYTSLKMALDVVCASTEPPRRTGVVRRQAWFHSS